MTYEYNRQQYLPVPGSFIFVLKPWSLDFILRICSLQSLLCFIVILLLTDKWVEPLQLPTGTGQTGLLGIKSYPCDIPPLPTNFTKTYLNNFLKLFFVDFVKNCKKAFWRVLCNKLAMQVFLYSIQKRSLE